MTQEMTQVKIHPRRSFKRYKKKKVAICIKTIRNVIDSKVEKEFGSPFRFDSEENSQILTKKIDSGSMKGYVEYQEVTTKERRKENRR